MCSPIGAPDKTSFSDVIGFSSGCEVLVFFVFYYSLAITVQTILCLKRHTTLFGWYTAGVSFAFYSALRCVSDGIPFSTHLARLLCRCVWFLKMISGDLYCGLPCSCIEETHVLNNTSVRSLSSLL